MPKFSKKMGGKEVGDASVYAQPHEGSKAVKVPQSGKRPEKRSNQPDWVPLDGVGIGSFDKVKTDGIKIRGTGAATKGTIARGPMG